MCGIAGIVDFSGASRGDDVRRMIAQIAHRGPDHSNVRTEGPVALGHARLSIIDLSAAGNQPMASADGSSIICYNGEVYNFEELRVALIGEGFSFRGRSDTEVVLEAWRCWGSGALARLNGIFAFAVWDAQQERLSLVRDRFGVKPLYYSRLPGGGLAFGSEIKAVLQATASARSIESAALHEFLYFGVGGLGSKTFFQGVHKVEAGSVLTIDRAGEKHERYWHAEAVAPITDTFAVAVPRVRHLLEKAVKRQLVSDVPVGVFLSGGIDSSAIAAFASRHYGGKLSTYSVGFDFTGDVDELPKAAQVAKAYGTNHHELHVTGADLPETIRSLVEHHDAPFSDAANIPLYLLCRELKGHIKVVLQGDGGDECFAGYRRYSLLAMWPWLAPAARLRILMRSLPVGGPRSQRITRLLALLAVREPGLRMAWLLTMEPAEPTPLRILGAGWRELVAATDPFVRYCEMAERFKGLDEVQKMLYTDTQILLPDVFLEKVDRATMAHGIEARVPFLDNELAGYAMGLPAGFKVRRGQKKYILRQALRGVVPDGILDGPKVGFGVPYARWLKSSLAVFAREVILDGSAAVTGMLDREVLAKMLAEHKEGIADHGFLLWKALNLSIWHDKYLASPPKLSAHG